MLRQLSVRDFAIVEAIDLELGPGMTVISGETGAGKSLLVDALLLLSGARADAGMIRAGSERAELSAEFDLTAVPAAREWLSEQALDDGESCLIRRVIRREGASRVWINGRAATAQSLNELTGHLLEIHGQHEHQRLLERPAQLELLDRHGHHEAELAGVIEQADRWHALRRQRAELIARAGDGGERAELLRQQWQELEAAATSPGELDTLKQDHHRLAHQHETVAACSQARDLLDGDQSGTVLATLARIRQAIDKASEHDPALVPIGELLASADIELREVGRSLDAWLDDTDPDPERLARIEQRLSRLHELARRYRVPVSELSAYQQSLAAELELSEQAGSRLQALDRDLAQASSAWSQAARALTTIRTATAERLGAQVSALMAELGMIGGQFQIALLGTGNDEPDRLGGERAEFLVSANPGQPPRPLRKVASGGELSRIALALEVAALGDDPVPTMVFDEVDAGIGGATAEILGQKLRRLGSHAQVLCVTHLPQVAAQGHAHIAVSKHRPDTAGTSAILLDGDDRTQEIARMLGGVELTDATLAHAQQMLDRAGSTNSQSMTESRLPRPPGSSANAGPTRTSPRKPSETR